LKDCQLGVWAKFSPRRHRRFIYQVGIRSRAAFYTGEFVRAGEETQEACGSSGTVKDGVIEIQGENREKIADILRKLGYKVKVAGG
jgi:translation initiation factor 1 (eIF-1/SUI1)